MAIYRNLGGDRLGSGNKMQVEMHDWGKSTHNVSRKLKTSMGVGTLVPCLKELVTPGSEYRIKINADLISKPTNGPLFGSFKYQVDTFFCPFRLYNAFLHNNKLGIAMQINQIKLPQMELEAGQLDYTKNLDNQQISSSNVLAYLGIRGLGRPSGAGTIKRQFNATPWIAYWDIVKNYYINKQEQNAYFINKAPQGNFKNVSAVTLKENSIAGVTVPYQNADKTVFNKIISNNNLEYLRVAYATVQTNDNIVLIINGRDGNTHRVLINELLGSYTSGTLQFEYSWVNGNPFYLMGWDYATAGEMATEPTLKAFPVVNIDSLRQRILTYQNVSTPATLSKAQIVISGNLSPFTEMFATATAGTTIITSLTNNQEGLAIKTYQSDIFNSFLRNDYVALITSSSSIAVVGNQITIDQIQLAKKQWEHMSRLVASGGTWRDYIEVAYGVRDMTDFEIPMYLGGLSKEVVFQEIVSNADTAERPLASIAGKGTFSGKHKGGYVELNAKEPGYLLGIMSLTPRIDYTQGNDFDVNLTNLDELHKPAFDGLGYQDLSTDQMAWFDTSVTSAGVATYKSAGKVPAWLNYMTSYNKALGTLADESEMWLILGRRYENNTNGITDLTTYVDPKKFNYIWADGRRDAQNFWVEIEFDITKRAPISAKQLPNF